MKLVFDQLKHFLTNSMINLLKILTRSFWFVQILTGKDLVGSRCRKGRWYVMSQGSVVAPTTHLQNFSCALILETTLCS